MTQHQLTALFGQPVTLTATIIDDPAAHPTKKYQDFKLGQISRDGRPLPGEIKVRLYQLNLHRGYQVRVTGKIKSGYLGRGVEMSYPQLTVISSAQSPLEQVRARFFAGMKTALPEPVASFGLGLLVGIRALIPKDLQSDLAIVGLSHLVAVSGYNLTIIVNAAHRLLQRWGRGVALVVSLWVIGTFLAVTGASASIVRASLVAVLALLAAFYGRRFQPLVLILAAAAATACYKPDYLTDLGWLLSFLAFFGIMVLAPAYSARFGEPRHTVTKLFLETSAAQIMTIPLILYMFGDFSVVAPLSNVVVLPLVPAAMLLGFVAGLAGMFLPAFAGWLAWPAYLLLAALLQLVDWLAALPGASTKLHITWPVMLASYGLILFVTWLMLRRAPADAPRHRHTLLEPVQLPRIDKI